MAAIFERHHQALQRYCYSILASSDDAADALQNTMIKALRALPGEKRQIALRPWLYRIAHNESISLLRARRTDSDLDAAAHVSDAAAANVVESRQRLRSLTEDLVELTERQRSTLLMRELGGLTFTQVADALGTSPSAVKQSCYEARCALQAMQEGRTIECETIRRTLSDGDRRMLRGMRMRGHLRACAGCHAFEVALRHRRAQLTAMIPPLPVGAVTAMLHGTLGGGSSDGSSGLVAGLATTTNATTGLCWEPKQPPLWP
jgi:RNA polymerase sigma factor (sigma-70 family)